MYYKIEIIESAKQNQQERFTPFNKETKTFKTKEEATQFIKSRYGTRKKVKMYTDSTEGVSNHIGWIYSLGWQRDYSHGISKDNPKYLQQDWVTVSEVNEKKIV